MKIDSKKKKLSIYKLFIKVFPIALKASPVLFTVVMIISILHGVSWGLITLFNQRFFDKAAQLATGDATFNAAFIALIFLSLIHISSQLLNGIGNYLPSVYFKIVSRETSTLMHKKISKIHPIAFENTESLDSIEKAKKGKDASIGLVFLVMVLFTLYVPYFVTMSIYLISIKPLLIISIVIIFIPTALTQIIRAKVFSKLEDESAPIRRENDYYEQCIVSKEYFKETRILGSYTYFINLFKSSLELLNKLRFKSELKTTLLELSMKILGMLGYLGVLFLLFTSLMNKEITIGMFAAVYGSIGLIFSIMEEIICRHIGQMSENLGLVKNFVDFLDYEERKGEDIKINRNEDIIAKNLSFKYTGSDKFALKDISFVIKPKETIAIVGENGSGKSTLVKIISGLYLPNEGSLYFGEKDTRELSMKSLFSNVSTVFQKFQKYKLLLKENVAIGDNVDDINIKRLENSCDSAGFDKKDKCFNNGYETMLSREFDGVDISGGQWQRVAIARGFYKENEMIILDEPTASIDPIEETKIYNRFAKMSENKTSFIVTHRLGSVKLADRIMVLVDGELAQMGTHDELINNKGEYSRLYEAQKKWYT